MPSYGSMCVFPQELSQHWCLSNTSVCMHTVERQKQNRGQGRCLHVASKPGCISGQSGIMGNQGRSSPCGPSSLLLLLQLGVCSAGSGAIPRSDGGDGRAGRETFSMQDDAVTVDTRKVIGEKEKI